MATTSVQKVSTEDVKQAILTLMKENNAEFKQMLVEILPKLTVANTKKKKGTPKILSDLPAQTERIPYSEMPFWKANPDLKPLKWEGYGVSKEAIKELQTFFQEPGNEINDDWFEMLD